MTNQYDLNNTSADSAIEIVSTAFPDILLFADEEGQLVNVTDFGVQRLKYSRGELQKFTLKDLLAPGQKELFEDKLRVAANHKQKGLVGETVCLTQDKTALSVEVRVSTIRSRQNGKEKVLFLVRDLQQRKTREQTLLEKERAIATGQLSSCVGHDISNPLSVIKLYSEWLISELQNSLAGQEENPLLSHLLHSVQNIEESANRIEALMIKMRNYARSTEQEVATLEYKDAVNDALNYLQRDICDKGIRVETDFPEKNCTIMSQPDQLLQVFIHLIRNACEAFADYSEQKKPVIKITVQEDKDEIGTSDLMYTCTVSDNGPGMSQEVQTRMYAPFFSTKTAADAAGLGLSAVRNIIRRHGGDIQINSQPGQGTSVTFRLPATIEPIHKESIG